MISWERKLLCGYWSKVEIYDFYDNWKIFFLVIMFEKKWCFLGRYLSKEGETGEGLGWGGLGKAGREG